MFSVITIATLLLGINADITLTKLDGTNWKVYNKTISVGAHVPGSIYTDLQRNKVIGDPLYRDNDVRYRWVGRDNWTFSRIFHMSQKAAQSKSVVLSCEGLDTVASITVNGDHVADTDNMFVRYDFNLSGLVKPGNNTIIISFASAVEEGAFLAASYPYVVPPECPSPVQHGECHRNFVRKEQCSYSWDWGPSFPTQGIWKSIYINSFDDAVISNIASTVSKENNSWILNVEVNFLVGLEKVEGQVHMSLSAGVFVSRKVTISQKKPFVNITMSVSQDKVQTWWPNGYGSQPLYYVNVDFTSKGHEKSSKTIKVGFRTVELVQEPVSRNVSDGLTFYFRVNGLPIFLKGTNWIPADIFQERVTADGLHYLLTSARDMGMNSMRVWGGGIFESDTFYELADELGIMIWQDFLFSVSYYPTSRSFLQSVATEVSQQIDRLKHHACIIIWSGNNENEKALRQDWFKVKNFTLYYHDYLRLYVDTLKPIVSRQDRSRPFVMSSPSNGVESEREGYVAKDPTSELYGDIHFYNYGVDQWNSSVFRIPRMSSEYGIQAWCEPETLASVFDHDDYNVRSRMVYHRQHHKNGNKQMKQEISRNLNLPKSSNTTQRFIDFIYLTQINQAMSVKTQTEHYRRHQAHLLPDGRGLTMGALYWQLNDVWQAPTWASIDYAGRWKMLHYYAGKFFSSFLVSSYLRQETNNGEELLDVNIVVDNIPIHTHRDQAGKLSFRPVLSESSQVGDKIITSGNLRLTVFRYSSFSPLKQWTIPFKINHTSESVLTKPLSSLLTESACPDRRDCFITLSALTPSSVSNNWLTLSKLKHANISHANVKIASLKPISQREYEIEVTSDYPAWFVWLSTADVLGHFSDNGFVMTTPRVTVKFFSRSQVQLTIEKLSVKSLSNIQ